MNYTEFLRCLDQRSMFGVKLGLDNIRRTLEKLGSPHKKLKFIHIAGTNGKGSVAAMISSVLCSAGIKAGLYTSPHLVNVTERIRVNDKDITEQEIAAVAGNVIECAVPGITYFELLTAIAIEYFSSENVDIATMETGMGGRLDATNICDADVAVITDISMDHTEYLGNTLERIYREKMAIVKPGSIVIKSEELKEGIDYGINSCNLDFQNIWVNGYKDIKLNLLGRHQARNCTAAIKTLEVLRKKGYNTSSDSIYKGLAAVRWHGRFQIIDRNPLIILDGAHNEAGARALNETIRTYLPESEITLIFGILTDKDHKLFVDILSSSVKRIITVTPDSDRALPGDLIRTEKVIKHIPKVKDAVVEAKKVTPENGAILITGSLYLIGEILKNRW